MKDIYAFEPIWENWVIDEFLGSGAYGSVYKAHREDQFSRVKQYAAVKHISIPKQDGPGSSDIPFPSEEAKGQYYRNMLNQLIVEIDAMVSLRGKPNIVSYGEHKVVPKESNSGYDLFLRMELLTSISAYCPFEKYTEHPLSRSKVVQLGIDIATALETLESRDLVHRDIKPDNIFIDKEGNFKLGDFGTARVLETTGNASTKIGTPNYMAPEVFTRLKRYDQTVDIYSLGIMLYRYMNDGYLPFMSASALDAEDALTRRIQGEAMEPPCNADDELAGIILKACAYKAEDRYQNAQELKKDLIRYRGKKFTEVELPIVCVTDDGQEIFRGYKKIPCGSQVRITTEDIPYRKFVGEDIELISDREIVIAVNENGGANPDKAVFTFRDNRTLLSVKVQVICRDENDNEILVREMACSYQNRNLLKAPDIKGYKPVGQTEVEVEVLKNRTTRPPQVNFKYERETVVPGASDDKGPAECDVTVRCVLEDGEEILNSKRTCRENERNTVTAPEITGYVLVGTGSQEIYVSRNGDAEPDKVIFTYRKMKTEKKKVSLLILCRDDYGNELKRESAEAVTGQTISIAAPEIKGYRLVNENKKNIELLIDDKGVPGQNEVLFIYEKEKGSKKKAAIIGLAAAFVLIGAVIATWLFNRPVQKYTITWKHEDGSVLELDSEVAADSLPEFNGEGPTKPEDEYYVYSFAGWTPDIKPVNADAVYVAVFDKTEKEKPEKDSVLPVTNDEPDITPVPDIIITWSIEGETETTTVAFGEKPYHTDPAKAPDDRYTYEFVKWSPEVEEATEDTTYEAVFQKKTRSYTITWMDDAGKIIDTTVAEYEAIPEHAAPMKDSDQEYIYIFDGWQPEIKEVTEDTTYIARFVKQPLPVSSRTPVVVEIGSVIQFGQYEQDNISSNGPEPIEWIVLDYDEANHKALLISKYGLDAKPYNSILKSVTWETCTLRTWLNEDFLNIAFSAEELKAILLTDVNSKFQGNKKWNTDGGNNTRDRIFLLSYSEATRYFKISKNTGSNMAQAVPTNYAVAQGAFTSKTRKTVDEKAVGCWWLRSPGPTRNNAADVEASGLLSNHIVHDDSYIVRPAFWLNLESDILIDQILVVQTPAPDPTDTPVPSHTPVAVEAGSVIKFGHYEQDNLLSNGPEPIEWIVLDSDKVNHKALLISKYGLDAKPYNTDWTSVTWETCTLRTWLNGEFLNNAFRAEEQSAIFFTEVDGETNMQDRIFLLSTAEAYKYLNVKYQYSNIEARVAPTAYAIAHGANKSESFRTADGKPSGKWWLRLPSYHRMSGATSYVRHDGSTFDTRRVDDALFVVRPVLWLNLESDALVE